jgi:hypothetical protein
MRNPMSEIHWKGSTGRNPLEEIHCKKLLLGRMLGRGLPVLVELGRSLPVLVGLGRSLLVLVGL